MDDGKLMSPFEVRMLRRQAGAMDDAELEAWPALLEQAIAEAWRPEAVRALRRAQLVVAHEEIARRGLVAERVAELTEDGDIEEAAAAALAERHHRLDARLAEERTARGEDPGDLPPA